MLTSLKDETTPSHPNALLEKSVDASIQQLPAGEEEQSEHRINNVDNENENEDEVKQVVASSGGGHTLEPTLEPALESAKEPAAMHSEAQGTGTVDGARREDFQNAAGGSREASKDSSEGNGGERRSLQPDAQPANKLPLIQEEAPDAAQQQAIATEMEDQKQPQSPQLSGWIKATVETARLNKKWDSLSHGDVLFVPDPWNPAKSFLLQSGVLFGASTVLQTICGASGATTWPQEGVAHLLMLEAGSDDAMPELHSESLSFTLPPQPVQAASSDDPALKA